MTAILTSAQVHFSSCFFNHDHHIFAKCGSSVDCKVDKWSAWGNCNVACGGGTKTKSREVIEDAKNGGVACPDLEETDVCNTEECPGALSPFCFSISIIIISLLNCGSSVDCKVGPWRAVGECSASCDGGSKTIKREIVQEAEHGGEKCPDLEIIIPSEMEVAPHPQNS